MRCPACDSSEIRELPEPFGPRDCPAPYARCLACASLFAVGAPAAHALGAHDWTRVPRPAPHSRQAWRIARMLRGVGDVVLVGRADAALMAALTKRGLRVSACDPNPDIALPLSKSGLSAFVGTPGAGALAGEFDLAIVEGLIEYSAHPVEELVAIRRALRPGGRARIEAPQADGLALQQHGADFFLFAPPAARLLPSFDGLAKLCARAGFDFVTRSDAPPRSGSWHFRTQTYSRSWVRVLERAIDPLYRDRSVLVVTASVR
ncbi:MAG: hypothetical protein KJ042_04110 [Deltaproteobacteria bacterium]|nr:hypothetical protein [Deltaproteobacteria bacterium]